jgi:general secretion pathway protein N
MTGLNMIRVRGLRLPMLLALVLSLPASTTALSIAATDAAVDMELEPARQQDGPATPSVWEPAPTIQVRPVLPAPAPLAPPLSANPLWAIPLATLANTRERPIFSASRRPPPIEAPVVMARPTAPPPPPPRVERPPLQLVGTVAGDSESFGIFVDRGTSTALRLKLGEDYQGWRLRNVRGRDVALERDQQTVVLSLPQPGAEGTAAAPISAMPANNSTMDEEQAPSPPRRRR